MIMKKGIVFLVFFPAKIAGFAPKPISSWQRHSTCLKASQATATSTDLDAKQLDFTMGYMNKHHSDVLVAFATTFSEIGEEAAKRNAFSGGSFKLEDAKLVDISSNDLTLDVTVKERGKKDTVVRQVLIPLDGKLCCDWYVFCLHHK
jgi:hypothetical protein